MLTRALALVCLACFTAFGCYAAPAAAFSKQPNLVVITAEQATATAAALADYYAYPSLMGAEAAPYGVASVEGLSASQPVVGLPPLFWGLLLSFPGVVIVRLNSQERSATQKALLGAGINLAVFTALYFTVFSPVTQSK
jgi:hypothetical protein